MKFHYRFLALTLSLAPAALAQNADTNAQAESLFEGYDFKSAEAPHFSFTGEAMQNLDKPSIEFYDQSEEVTFDYPVDTDVQVLMQNALYDAIPVSSFADSTADLSITPWHKDLGIFGFEAGANIAASFGLIGGSYQHKINGKAYLKGKALSFEHELVSVSATGLYDQKNTRDDNSDDEGSYNASFVVIGKQVWNKADKKPMRQGLSLPLPDPIVKNFYTTPPYTFPVGPVPFTATGSANGEIGLKTALAVQASNATASFKIIPYAQVGVSGTVQPGAQQLNDWLRKVSAVAPSVEASGTIDVNLISAQAPLTFAIGSDGNNGDPDRSVISASMILDRLSALGGKISAKLKVTIPAQIIKTAAEICNKLTFGVLCKKKDVEKWSKPMDIANFNKTLFSWDGSKFGSAHTIFNYTRSIGLVGGSSSPTDGQPDSSGIISSEIDSTEGTLPAAGSDKNTSDLIAGHAYYLLASNSNKCLDVRDHQTQNGAALQQWDCTGEDQQKFRLANEGDGYFSLVGVQSNRCVSVQEANPANGTPIIQWDCHSGPDQRARLIPLGFGQYEARFANSDKCLTVGGGDTGNGAAVIQSDCNSGSEQHWIVIDTNSVPQDVSTSPSQGTAPEAGRIYTFTSRNSGKCLDVKDHSVVNGGLLQQWDCVGEDQQKFRLYDEGDGYYSLRGVQSNLCVSVAAGDPANGTAILQWDCHGGSDQKVRLVPTGKGGYSVHFSNADKCMDVKDFSRDNGGIVNQYDCSGNDNQDWILTQAG